MRRISLIVVHCLATRPSMDVGADWVNALHKKRGWLGNGYHGIIRRDGTYEPGRPHWRRGAHAYGHNNNSLGIAYAGGIDERGEPCANPTKRQLATLRSKLNEWQLIYPGVAIIGHGSLPNANKACPCFAVNHWLKTGEVQAVRGAYVDITD